jgi:hypothetical protein
MSSITMRKVLWKERKAVDRSALASASVFFSSSALASFHFGDAV